MDGLVAPTYIVSLRACIVIQALAGLENTPLKHVSLNDCKSAGDCSNSGIIAALAFKMTYLRHGQSPHKFSKGPNSVVDFKIEGPRLL